MADEGETAARAGWVLPARLALGLAQGAALYFLYHAPEAGSWPATVPWLYAPLLTVALYVPLMASQAMGAMRTRTLAAWSLAATAALAWLGFYDRMRATPLSEMFSTQPFLPAFSTLFLGAVGIFVAQALIAAGDAARRPIARYDAYFDAAWKQGLQLALAAVFVGAFWLVLWLGADLFELIRLDFLQQLIRHDWFWIPATTLAAAAAIELTDVRARLVSGIRGVVLTLMGWLLAVMTLLAAGFLVTLVFTGLEPLWATRRAAAGLLWASAALVILINAAYQNGEQERPFLLRLSGAIAAFALTPLALLAAYALWLRVGQYGWSVARLATLYCTIVAAAYAAGYGISAALGFARRGREPLLERTNILVSVLVLAILGSLFTRFTDPEKLAVDDQVGRLRDGRIRADDFDFYYLGREGGRYGLRALEKLSKAHGTGDAAIMTRQRAQAVLDQNRAPVPPGPADLHVSLDVYPRGKALPESFIRNDWRGLTQGIAAPACLTMAGQDKCAAILVDLDGDGIDEVIVASGDESSWWGTIMKADAKGHWAPVATLPAEHCAGDLTALEQGTFAVAPPVTPFQALRVGHHAIRMQVPDPDKIDCSP
ncbi:MAG TPA: DUF4153 domain-containing protein [Rhizomicrobium sp.]|nr:DUF4153 domain-containing protein [Rhizomicrobium sp.]